MTDVVVHVCVCVLGVVVYVCVCVLDRCLPLPLVQVACFFSSFQLLITMCMINVVVCVLVDSFQLQDDPSIDPGAEVTTNR